MRKEATLEQWRKLYEIALKIKELKPWEYLWDMDIITIMIPKYEEAIYCSVMGRNGECFAVGTYVGVDAIHGFYKMAEKNDIPPEQSMRYQTNMMCFLGDREHLSKEELKVIKDLGLNFRGKNEWVYFQSFKPGYTPYILDEQQVIELTLIFEQLFMALRAVVEKKIEVDFDQGNTLFRTYDDVKGLWITFEAPIMIPQKKLVVPLIQDDLLFAKINKKKITRDEIEIDTLYLNASINDKKFERPVQPKLLIIADHNKGMLIEQKMLSPKDDAVQEILGMLVDYFMNKGKPKMIYVRDEDTRSLLSDLCERTSVTIKIKGILDAIDTFAESFRNRGF